MLTESDRRRLRETPIYDRDDVKPDVWILQQSTEQRRRFTVPSLARPLPPSIRVLWKVVQEGSRL